jgi:hypothetical protein
VTRHLPMLIASIVMAGPALAQPLTIDGNYGNGAGCEELRTGAYENDDMFTLTPAEVSSYAKSCEFVSVAADSRGNQLATAICHFEGEETLGAEQFVIAPLPDQDGYRVFDALGEVWGEVRRCR